MKKKIIIGLLIGLLVLSGCEKEKEVENGNETTKVVDNSRLCYNKLCFGLPNEYEVKDKNMFVINNKMYTIRVEIGYHENISDDLKLFIENDGKEADLETLQTVSINEKNWYKVKNLKGETFYYFKNVNTVYSVEVYPVIDASEIENKTIEMLEKTISFEK